MSGTENAPDEITTMGDHHSPAPPKDGAVKPLGDHHSPAPPADGPVKPPKGKGKGGATTLGDHHSPPPPRD
ncbi:hypothetical protein [Streptomyces sp. NPDC005805]|uniref:hypothetical protein n=1 Tax=Streptomyces sp. NPDC005805 TaxID=3157068 RepID=UPI003403707E